MTNQNTTTSNQELLSWAVENIKEGMMTIHI